MSGSSSGQASEARGPSAGRAAYVDAELLAPPEADPVQLHRNMFAQPAPRPPPAPLTNLHLQKVARLDAGGGGGGGGGRGPSGSGASGGGGGGVRGRPARSVAASSVRGGRKVFSEVSDEEVIDVDGEPTTLADDDLDLPPASPGSPYGDHPYGAGGDPRGAYHHGGPGLGQSGIAGLGGAGGAQDVLEELEMDTPMARLHEAYGDLDAERQGSKDPWVIVELARMVLAQAKVVWRTMPVQVREEPLLLAKAHFELARAYQGLGGCDRQASDHGKEALAAIPRDVADTEGARALKTEVQVMRAEALLSSAGVPGLPPDAGFNQARKALALLIKAGGLTEPVAWTQEEVDENELPGHIQRATIDKVTDMGIVALMAQCHGVMAEARLRGAEAEEGEKRSSLRSASEAASRLDRKTERGDFFYSAEQMDKYRAQEDHYRDEADSHQAEALRLAAEAERAFDAAMYCLNAVIDQEGSRLEEDLGREGKLGHPTFQALWRRSLDFMAGIANAYAIQRKDSLRLGILDEVLAAFVQYGNGGWMPAARHIQALKDKGTLLVDKRDYEGAMSCYETLTEVVSELFAEDAVRKDLQVAESLKLRGDVALAAGDFRTAQHMFNQALELYQRHLGPQAPVAQDLLHRIDEVKSYLADARVMGRLASFPGRTSQTVAASVMAHSASGSGAGSASTTPKSASMASRASGGPRPPPLPLSGVPVTSRASSGLATPLHLDGAASNRTSHANLGSARQSIDGFHPGGGGGGPGSVSGGGSFLGGGGASGDAASVLNSPAAMSAVSGLQPRQSSSSSGLPALTGSRRPSYGSGIAPAGRTSGGGSLLDAVSGGGAGGAGGEGADGGADGGFLGGGSHVAASVAGSHRSGWAAGSVAGSMSRRSIGGGGGEGGVPGSPMLSHRSGDLAGVSGGVSGGGWGGTSHHEGGDLGGSPSATSLSQRSRTSGFGVGGFGTGTGTGGVGGGDAGGGGVSGAGWPGAPASHHSGELGGSPSVASLSGRSRKSGFGVGGFSTGGGGADGGGADTSGGGWPGAPASHHSGELGGSPSVASLSRRSNASGLGGAAAAATPGAEGSFGGGAPAASHHSGEELGGSPSAKSLSHVGGRTGGGFDPEDLRASAAMAALPQNPPGWDGGFTGGRDFGAAAGSTFGGSRRASGADFGLGASAGGGAAERPASVAGSVAASRRISGDLYGGVGAAAATPGSQAGSLAASRRMSGDLLGAFAAQPARPGSPSGASVKSAAARSNAGGGGGGTNLYGLGNSGDLGGFGGAAEPAARPASPSAMSQKSVARSTAGGGAGGFNFGGGGGMSGDLGGGGGGFGDAAAPPRPGSPSAASTKSYTRGASGYGGLGGGSTYGGGGDAEPARPGSPSAASQKSGVTPRAGSGYGLGGGGGGGGSTYGQSGDLSGFGGGGGGFGAERPASPSAMSQKSVARSTSGGGAGAGTGAGGFNFDGGVGGMSGDLGAGGAAQRPGSPSAMSQKSASRGYGGGMGGYGNTSGEYGSTGGDGGGYGGEPARPASPSAASNKSYSRSGTGALGGGGGGGDSIVRRWG